MKYKFWLILAVFAAAALTGCSQNSGKVSSSPLEGENLDKDASYAFGMNIGASLAADSIVPNLDEFFQGIRDIMSGRETRFSEYEAVEIIQAAFYAMMEQQEALSMQAGAEVIQEGVEFLAENSKKPGIEITSSGLQYEVISQANGRKPSEVDIVRVHYEGRLIDGTIFDSSYNWGEPVEFPLNGVIPGWTEGLQLMSIGSKYRLFIPYELGYGSRAAGPIPAYSVLIFEVELLDIL